MLRSWKSQNTRHFSKCKTVTANHHKTSRERTYSFLIIQQGKRPQRNANWIFHEDEGFEIPFLVLVSLY